MKKYLDVFEKVLTTLGTDNVVLGGSGSLKAHGLILNREMTDLDIIIYRPTVSQMKFIEQISFFEIENKKQKHFDKKYSYKFKRKDLILNILLQENKDIPNDLLYFKYGNIMYKVQSIENTVAAKRSYMYNSAFNGNSTYIREKDVRDFIDLKNSNFNLGLPVTTIPKNETEIEY